MIKLKKISALYKNKNIKSKLIKLLVFYFSSVLLITSCMKKDVSNSYDEKPYVLTTFTILADMASNVAGERLSVRSITKPGVEIHGYQFTPRDIIRAKGAELIIENGLGLESWMYDFVNSLGSVPSVSLTDGMKPIMIEGDAYSGKPNPHAWMSPKRAMNYVDKIVEAFIEIDPDGENEYKTNALIYKNKLAKLDKELRDSLNLIPKERKVLVTCEGAFTYLAQDYGLKEAYLWPVNSENQVTPRRMVNLIEKIKESGVPTIFCESTVSSKEQMEVAKESGSNFGGVFYVDSLSDPNGPAPTLIDLQKHNIRLITKGLVFNAVNK
tara:strand:+ start:62 stop:1036 length:975 start_codon:yes stop_codon:yes gene_type:complete